MEWPSLELPVTHFANDRNTIGPVKRDGCEIKNCRDSGVRSKTNQVDEHTSYGEKPHCVNRGICPLVDLVPDSRQGQHFVASIRPNRSGASLDSYHRSEVENETSGHSEEDTSSPPDDVVEDLSYGLGDGIVEGVTGIAAAVS